VKRADVIQNFMYKYLASIDAGVDYESARELAMKANINELLQCRDMGGCTQWTLDEFLLPEPWDELGGKAGLKVSSKKLLTLVAAAGRKFGGSLRRSTQSVRCAASSSSCTWAIGASFSRSRASATCRARRPQRTASRVSSAPVL
jgi:hypothetical protein